MNRREVLSGIGGVIVAGAVITGAIFTGQQIHAGVPQTEATSAAVVHEESRAFVAAPSHPAGVIAVVVTPPLAVAPAPSGPILCPEGTTANSVDDAGNESNCQDNGIGDQPCVAYDDNNNCTAYYKP